MVGGLTRCGYLEREKWFVSSVSRKTTQRYTAGTNATLNEEHGFGDVLNDMLSSGSITERRLERVRIYAKGDDEHADDLALVAVLRKAEA